MRRLGFSIATSVVTFIGLTALGPEQVETAVVGALSSTAATLERASDAVAARNRRDPTPTPHVPSGAPATGEISVGLSVTTVTPEP